ncbi:MULTISPECIES: hypothetical protein [Moorena]|nr:MULTISPECIES: hypothetical protein [Moorena]NEP31125.1 hypothetical protein [Moorena sp. SIO3B2]EGJ29520.1 hypothetical protein LYNGBM3L_62260 [Moorena producens 3L]NEP65717.1 hypothetical protein [Moorena sp. SIO3A5]NEQ07153.1 hypothetical protein [Moorena sp. SIO4E2]NES44589.1 hypothetical protein [Moorena sp. SIO2C4]
MPLLDPNRSYSFSEIAKLKTPTDEILAEYGYSLERTLLDLRQYQGELDRLQERQSRLEEILPYLDLSNEQSRREMLIAPVMADLIHYTRAQLRIEYSIKVSNQLQGALDYLLRTTTNLLVVEAKQEDLTNGFTQMAVELIALDQWEKCASVEQQPQLFGAVSTGTIWQFGILHRQDKLITQQLTLYRVPTDLEPLTRILIAALSSSN